MRCSPPTTHRLHQNAEYIFCTIELIYFQAFVPAISLMNSWELYFTFLAYIFRISHFITPTNNTDSLPFFTSLNRKKMADGDKEWVKVYFRWPLFTLDFSLYFVNSLLETHCLLSLLYFAFLCLCLIQYLPLLFLFLKNNIT